MRDTSRTPNIAVTIGGQLRVYYAYVTTAGPDFDGPTTMTLFPYQESDLAIGLLLELDRQGFNLKFTPDNHVRVRPFGRLTSMRACWSSGDVTGRHLTGSVGRAKRIGWSLGNYFRARC